MKITKSDYEKLNSKLSKLEAILNGGKGSGNFGHSGREGKVGGSGKSGGGSGGTKASEGSDVSKTKLEGPAKTHDEYVYSDASDECKDEYGEVYSALSEHAEWIADAGGFSEGISRDDYFDLADKLARESDFNRKDKYTQRDLVEGLKRTLEDTREYGLSDGSASTDKANDFLEKYDFDNKPNRSADEHDRMMRGAERAWDEKNAFENGGKGSGNFGHSGRPGKRGGSGGGKGGKYAVGDTFEKDGETFTVEEDGRGGKEGVSADRKVVTTTPDDYIGIRGEMQLDRLSQVGVPKGATEEVDRLYKKIGDGDAEGADSYLETAVGALSGWAEGNGGTAKPQSDEVKEKINDVITDMVLDTIDVDYKARGQKMDDIVSKIGDKIYETGDEYICPKKEMIDGIKGSIKILHDDYPDINDFKEQASGTIEDLRDVMKMSPKSYVAVSEHPMSASGLVYRELSKKDTNTISEGVVVKITEKELNKLKDNLSKIEKMLNGGAGSGNFGHAGRIGKRGGSARGIGAGALHKGTEVAEERTGSSGSEGQAESFSFTGGSPESVLDVSERGHIQEATGVGLKYTDGIRLGYGEGTISPAPFAIDDDSKSKLDKNFKEQDEIYQRKQDISSEQKRLVEGHGYEDEKGWDIHYYSSEGEVSGSNMPVDKKKAFIKLIDENRKLSSRADELRHESNEICNNAKYYPKLYGTKGAILAAGLAVGVGEYLGQRSDGAGEGSFNHNTELRVNQESIAHREFLKALSNPYGTTKESFEMWRDASAKLASSQASYLKRVETSIADKNVLGSERLKNVAQTIKKMSYDEAKADLSTSGSEYVEFRNGKPIIKKIK